MDSSVMYEPMNPRFRLFLFGLGLVTVLAIGIWLAPRAVGFYYQTRGGELLGEVYQSDGGLANGIACEKPPLVDEGARAQLSSAILELQKAIKYNPNSSHSFLQLGRAYCLLGDTEKASAAYKVYVSQRPENPLGHLELALSYIALCSEEYTGTAVNISPAEGICEDEVLRRLVNDELDFAQVDESFIPALGSSAFSQRNFKDAVKWFLISSKLSIPLSPADIFLWDLSLFMNGDRDFRGNKGLLIHPLDNSLAIEAEDFQLLLNGDFLKEYSLNPQLGELWWTSTAVTAVVATNPGVYSITIRAMHSQPPPIELQIEHNFEVINKSSLNLGDFSWEELRREIYLETGPNILGVSFLNDGSVNGVDRNTYLDWMKIELK